MSSRGRKRSRKVAVDGRRDGAPVEQAAAEGDWRGPYGYGHRAYRPDPSATYSFEPGPPRTLPPAAPPAPEPEFIWKRPLR